jgi:hypothetical protein
MNEQQLLQNQSDYEKFLYENIESLYKDASSTVFNLKQLPDDDIQIIDIPKRFETVELSKPELEYVIIKLFLKVSKRYYFRAEIDLHVNECLRSYNSNYLYLVKK